MGGKQALFPTIIRRFPTGYQNMVYVEVFGGGGSVLLNKERSVREVLNDANGNLINLYRVVREHPDELKDRLLYVLHSREDFKIAQRRLAQFSYKDDILRAADFYQVVRQSYAGNGKQFCAVARSMWAGFPAIDRVAGRLQGVTLEKEDFGVIFQRHDSPTTVFYIDPPYFFTEDYYPGNIFLRSDHQRLAAILLNAEGLWLQFTTTGYADHYDAIKLAVINRTDGVVDQQLFRFSDIIGQQAVRGRDPINPHIWDYNGRLEWYRPISQEQRSQIANTILDYVGMYQEETEENDFTMKL